MGKDEDPLGGGWIKLYRKTLEKGYYKESQYLHLWIHCLLRANHKDREVMVDGNLMTIKRGQFLTSRNKLFLETGIQESKIERILKLLKSEQQIEQVSTRRYRLISILNYDKHQTREQVNEPLVNNSRTTGEHKQELKNDKNEINKPGDNDLNQSFKEFWKLYPKKMHPDVAEAAYMKVAKAEGPEILMKALIGYMNHKEDEARRKGREPDRGYFKQPENFLEKEFWRSYVEYEKEGPQL